MLRNLFSRLSLLTRFSIVAFLVMLVVAIGLAAWLEDKLQSDALWAVAENTATQVNNSLNPSIDLTDLEGPISGQRYESINELIHKTLLSSDIVRIKIWNPEGMLIYSDDPTLIGQIFEISTELQDALNGRMATEISELEKAENITERDQFTRLFEVYVPLQPDGVTDVKGAYEVYYDLNQLEPRLARIRRAVWGGVGVGFLFLYLSLFFLLLQPSRELIRRNQENKRLLLAERDQRQLSETLERVSLALSGILDLRRLLDLICLESTRVFGTQAAYLWLVEGDELVGFSASGSGADQFIGMRYSMNDPVLLGARIARERLPLFINDAPHSSRVDQKLIHFFGIQSILGTPLTKGDHVLGALMVIDTIHPYRFRNQDLERVSVFGSHAAVAIDNAQLYEQAKLHLEHERALREIDQAITSSSSLDTIFELIIQKVLDQLRVDAAAIFVSDQDTGKFFYKKGMGFQSRDLEISQPIVENFPGGFQNGNRQITGVHERYLPESGFEFSNLFNSEGFKEYFTAPLISKNNLLGLLGVFHRSPMAINSDWQNFLETLAGQTAIAIDNENLFSSLQRSNVELSQAYDAAIEGWSAALDLRDRETEGHTRRVTEMTVKLAGRLGFGEEELIHVRRGALLHDIGKMGVPDRILLKDKDLTEEEWIIMRKHPTFAYELLRNNAFLTPALDIAHFHHERWNGSGYPDGLKREDIPLAARIFAVVDVYDALTSDRPYRLRWSTEKAIEHIRSLTGIHFDPNIVETFLQMLTEI
jgi:putative nucleotidyltransferase with HDIG domain